MERYVVPQGSILLGILSPLLKGCFLEQEDGFPLKSGYVSITRWQFLPTEKQIKLFD